jgi:hypothetical protein
MYIYIYQTTSILLFYALFSSQAGDFLPHCVLSGPVASELLPLRCGPVSLSRVNRGPPVERSENKFIDCYMLSGLI